MTWTGQRLLHTSLSRRFERVSVNVVDRKGALDGSQLGDVVFAHNRELPALITSMPHFKSALIVGDEHNFVESRDPLVMGQFFSAVICLSGGAQNFYKHDRIHDGVLLWILWIQLQATAHDGNVGISAKPRFFHADPEIGTEHAARPIAELCADEDSEVGGNARVGRRSAGHCPDMATEELMFYGAYFLEEQVLPEAVLLAR